MVGFSVRTERFVRLVKRSCSSQAKQVTPAKPQAGSPGPAGNYVLSPVLLLGQRVEYGIKNPGEASNRQANYGRKSEVLCV